jgi:hypothetical protein
MDFTCDEVNDRGYTFKYYAIDPGSSPFSDKYAAETIPSNLVLDDEMIIRYKMGDYIPGELRNIINTLLSE